MSPWPLVGMLVLGAVLGTAAGALARLAARRAVGAAVAAGRYEAAGAIGGALAAGITDGPAETSAAVALIGWCLSLCATDLRVHRLPNVLTLPGFALIVAYAAAGGRAATCVLAGVVLAGLYGAVWLVSPASMGAGDVKLALGIGAVTGLAGATVWLCAAVLAPILTAGWGIASVRRTGGRVPHGPSMCLAALGALAVASWG